MTIYSIIALVLTMAALLGYINERTLRLPTTIAIMAGSIVFSLAIIILGKLGAVTIEDTFYQVVSNLNFGDLLMQGMLSFLLFAGALTIDLQHLRRYRWEIASLACLGTVLSTFLIGTLTYYGLLWLGIPLAWLHCLLFGALISPTDPIAVLAIFKQVGAPKSLDTIVSGESLFNDGVGIVIFLTLYELSFSGTQPSLAAVSVLFLREAIGGLIFGIFLGLLGHHLMKATDNYKVEVLLSLAIASGGYLLANSLGVSGPLAMVAAGIILGNRTQTTKKIQHTQEHLENFWELMDEILNAALFLLMGFELLIIPHQSWQMLISLLIIPVVLIVRFSVCSILLGFFKRRKPYPPHSINILVWGGLRGGLAIALALALPNSPARDTILSMTYAIVVFSILVQGLTIKPLVRLAIKS